MIAGMLSGLGSALAYMVSKVFSKKVLIRVAIIGVDYLVKKSKPTWDDQLWKPLKEELEKEI